MTYTNFELQIWSGLKISIAHINSHYVNQCEGQIEDITVAHTNWTKSVHGSRVEIKVDTTILRSPNIIHLEHA